MASSNELLPKLKSIEITANSELWKSLKKMAPFITLNNISVHFITSQSLIDYWELLDIPKIKINHFVIDKDFKPVTSPNEMAPAQDYNRSRSNKARFIAVCFLERNKKK